MATYDSESEHWRRMADERRKPFAFREHGALAIASAVGLQRDGEFVPAPEIADQALAVWRVVNRSVRRLPVRLRAALRHGFAVFPEAAGITREWEVIDVLHRTLPSDAHFFAKEFATAIAVQKPGLESSVTAFGTSDDHSIESQFFCSQGPHEHGSARTVAKGRKADAAILVALDDELDAVVARLGGASQTVTADDIRTYSLVRTPTGLTVVVAKASGMGQLDSALVARDIVAQFEPSCVILVGITAGLGAASLGDVVVPDQIVDYELGKVTGSGTQPRWSVHRTNALLRERLLAYARSAWGEGIGHGRPDSSQVPPKLHTGVMLSGNKVIADATAAGSLSTVWSRAVAIEMEAAGIAAALHQLQQPPAFLVVKAVSDRADAAKNDLWRFYAADAAATLSCGFVSTALRSTDLQRKASSLGPAEARTPDFRRMRIALGVAFNLGELKILAADLGIDWENIGGAVKDEKILELLLYTSRRQRLPELIEMVKAERPGLMESYEEA